MKQGFLKLAKTVIAPVALVAAMAFSPVGAFAQNRGGGHSGGRQGGFNGGGHSGGRQGGFNGGGNSFSAQNRGNFGGGHAFSAPSRGFSGGFRGGRESYGGRGYDGGVRGGRGFYGGRGYDGGRGYYGSGFGFGVGVYAPYGYAAPVCNPAGFYDQYGNWQYYPGCAVPYGY